MKFSAKNRVITWPTHIACWRSHQHSTDVLGAIGRNGANVGEIEATLQDQQDFLVRLGSGQPSPFTSCWRDCKISALEELNVGEFEAPFLLDLVLCCVWMKCQSFFVLFRAASMVFHTSTVRKSHAYQNNMHMKESRQSMYDIFVYKILDYGISCCVSPKSLLWYWC